MPPAARPAACQASTVESSAALKPSVWPFETVAASPLYGGATMKVPCGPA
jgi:hypothetical protein